MRSIVVDTRTIMRSTAGRRCRPSHPYVPSLLSLPGAGWILAYTIAAEIGARVDIASRMVESIWHMVATEQTFAPANAAQVLAA